LKLGAGWTHNSYQLIVQADVRMQCMIDSFGQSADILVVNANYDAAVRSHGPMQPYKVFAIKGQDRPVFANRKIENLRVGNPLICPPGTISGQNVVTEMA
jgi:hypothetical protein